MTDVEIAKNSLDVLHKVFQPSSTLSVVSKLVTFSGTIASVLPLASAGLFPLASVFQVLGAILGLVEGFLPGNHEEILSRFQALSRQVDQVRDDIQRLRIDIGWDITEAQYASTVDRIETGIEYCVEIGSRSRKEEKMLYQEKLRAHCANENCAKDMKDLLNGIIGEGLFRSNSILDKLYDKTQGNRSRISEFATQLLQLANGGIMVMSTHETMIFGMKGAADTTKPLYRQLDTALGKVQSVLDRCVRNFEGNMLKDLNKTLDKGGPNKDLVANISNFMSYKYDWLEIFALVYNDLSGYDKHCFNGHRVSSLHRNQKCGIVFYRTRGEPPKYPDRYDEAYNILDEGHCGNAKAGFESFEKKLDVRGIGWSGFLVISQNDPDLRFKSTFSTRAVYLDNFGKNIIECYKKKIILLLE